MIRNKHLLKALIFSGFFLSAISSLSCDLFYESTREYLERYSSEIINKNPEPAEGMDWGYDNNHNLCISSSKDFTFQVYISNPNNVISMRWPLYLPADERGSHDIDDFAESLHTNNIIKFDYNYNNNPNIFYITFDKDWLKSKDVDGQRDFLTCVGIVPEEPANLPASTPFPLRFKVNSKPDIIRTNEGDYNPTFGTYLDSESNLEYQFLCFNLKSPEDYDTVYSDIKAAANGHYIITINNQDYTFYYNSSEHKFIFDDSSSFITKKPTSSELKIKSIDYSDFNAGNYPVYFLTKSKNLGAFNVSIKDTSGLESKYSFSTKPSGKYQLDNADISQNQDLITITPNLTATNLINNESVTTSKVFIKYKLKESADWEVKECISQDDKVEIYLPGGTSNVYYKQTGMSSDWKPSVESSEEYTLDNIVYVSSSPSNEAYNGAIANHPCSLKKAFNTILKNKNDEWTCYLVDSLTASNTSDFVSNTSSYIYFKNTNTNFKLTIKSESSTNHKTINANQKGRVLQTEGFDLTLQNLNITGGKTSSNGGAVLCDKKLTISNCDFYSNEGYFGGAIYCSGSLDINYGVFYSNTASIYGGAIYFTNKNNNMVIKNSEIGRAGYQNKATKADYPYGAGGGIYIKSDSTSEIKNTTIGVKDINALPTDTNNFGNSAANGGGLYCENYSEDKKCVVKFYDESNICGNYASQCGGGFYFTSGRMQLNQRSSSISVHHNQANTNGGGGYLAGSSILDAGYIIDNNNASSNGGGLCMIGSSSLQEGQITYNSASNKGGGIYYNSTGGISSSSSSSAYTTSSGTINSTYGFIIQNNTATSKGGGIYVTASDFTLKHCDIQSNTSAAGAGVYTDKSMTVTKCNISGNKKDANTSGDAIYTEDSTITFNNELNINENNSIYMYKSTSPGPSLDFPTGNSVKPDFYNTKLKVNANFSNKQVITTTQPTTYYSKIELVPTDFVSVVYDSKLMVISTNYVVSSSRSLQTIIDSLKDTAFEDSPGIIVFNSDITESANSYSYGNGTKTYYSRAVFKNYSSGSKRKYIILGNGKYYNANRSNSAPGSAFCVEPGVTVEINNLRIYGGYAKKATDWETGGGLYVDGTVYLNNSTYIGLTPGSHYTPDAMTANNAGRGGGIYVANGGYVEVDNTSAICGNMVSFISTGIKIAGGGVYIENGGYAKFVGLSLSRTNICYNKCTYGTEGGAIFVETGGQVNLYNTEIHHNYIPTVGVPGIYLADEAIFLGSNLVMHDNSFDGTPGNTDYFGSAIHCAGKLYIDTSMPNCSNCFSSLNLYNNEEVDFLVPMGIKMKGEPFGGQNTYSWWYGLFGGNYSSSTTPTCTFMAGYGTTTHKKVQFTANQPMACPGGTISIENYAEVWTPGS